MKLNVDLDGLGHELLDVLELLEAVLRGDVLAVATIMRVIRPPREVMPLRSSMSVTEVSFGTGIDSGNSATNLQLLCTSLRCHSNRPLAIPEASWQIGAERLAHRRRFPSS